MRSTQLPDAQRQNFAQLLQSEMQKEQEESGVGPEEAFLRVAVRNLGFDPDDKNAYHTDGAYDCGFDFIHVSEEAASIFQAKTLEYDKGLPLEVELDASYLSDLRRITEVLSNLNQLPKEANRSLTEALTSLRNEVNRRALLPEYSREPVGSVEKDERPEYRISIYFLGLAKGFKPQAKEEYARLEAISSIDCGRVVLTVTLLPFFIDDLLAEKWQQRNVDWKDKTGRKREEITLHVQGEAIVDAKSAVFFTPAYDLVQAYEDFGYQIFEPNVRCELKESKVNQAIKKTVTTREGRRELKHLNNGITVVCTGWSKKQAGGKLVGFVVRRAGVVNGLQTVKSLHDAFRRLAQDEQLDFKENCLVLCRLHQEGSVKRLEQLVKATNNQNPMKPRNLRSNDPEQVAFETLFANLGWFYERKQGAWDAFKADPRAWRGGLQGKRLDNFLVNGRTYRVIDNDLMGQNWLAFIGFSTEAINEKRTIFDREEYYTLIFLKKTASHGYDYEFKLTLDSRVHSESQGGSANPAAMLVASLCRDVADNLALTRPKNRELAIERLGIRSLIRDEQDRILDTDPEYQKQKILRGMLTLFVEFVGFVLFKSLEGRFHTDAGRMLENGSFKGLAMNLDYSRLVDRHRNQTYAKDDLIIILYCAFEHCIGQLYESNWLRGYNDAPVKNKYIYSVRTRRQLLDELSELDKRFGRTEMVRRWADGFNDAKGIFAFVRKTLLG